MSIKDYPPIEFLRQCFDYNDGKLFWKERPRDHFPTESGWKKFNTRWTGTEAGTLRVKTRRSGKKIYRCVVAINRIFVHRSTIVYAVHNNEYPQGKDSIDHKDRDTLNDRIDNLRISNPTQSSGNTSIHYNNRSGFKGVTFCKTTNRWRATMTVEGKSVHLGRFDTREEAHAAYVEAAKERYGEFYCPG